MNLLKKFKCLSGIEKINKNNPSGDSFAAMNNNLNNYAREIFLPQRLRPFVPLDWSSQIFYFLSVSILL